MFDILLVVLFGECYTRTVIISLIVHRLASCRIFISFVHQFEDYDTVFRKKKVSFMFHTTVIPFHTFHFLQKIFFSSFAFTQTISFPMNKLKSS